MYKIKRFIRRITKLITFLPVIWKDEDWDFYYLLVLVSVKLTFMKDYFQHSGIITEEDTNKIITGIDETLNAIKDFVNADKYGIHRTECPIEIDLSTEKIKNSTNYRVVTVNKATGKELTEEEEKVYHKYLSDCVEEENSYWNKIFETLKREGRSWWD